MLRLSALFISLLCLSIWGYAQQSQVDSLNNVIKNAKHDTTRAQAYVLLTEIYAATNIDTVIPLCEKALAIADAGMKSADPKTKRAFQVVKVSAYNNIGYVYSMKDEIVMALEYYAKSKAELDLLGDKQGLANYYISIAYIYNNQGDVARALDHYQKSYDLQTEIGDKHGAASSLNNVAVIYNRQKDTAKAMEYFIRALDLYRQADEKIGEGAALNNIAALYEKQNDTTRALKFYHEALAVRREAEDYRGIGSTLNNLGALYANNGQPELALKYYNEALTIRERAKDKKGVAMTLNNMATTHIKRGDNDSAEYCASRALAIGQQIGYPEVIANSSGILSKLYASMGRYEDAYKMHVLFKSMADSMNNDASQKAAFRQQMKYNIDQREAQLKADQAVKDAQAEEEKKKQTIIIYAVSAGLLLVLALALFIFRGYKQKQKANEIITAQKLEVEKSKHIIEEKNKDILDSINYAKRIQQAKLPHPEDIQKIIPESFVLFMPKDIVSGDFYYFKQDGNYVFLAAADCTGHGVPGALMSMIGYEKINEAITMTDDVSQVLKLVNKGIKTSLRQTDSNDSTRDGMDIALCRIDLHTHEIKYAGANRPFWLARKHETEIHEIKPTKMALGGYTKDDQEFEQHSVQMDDGDTFYLFSDGYADLFSGDTGKKLTTKKFRQILLEMQNRDLHTQEVMLGDFAKSWSKGTEQIDDILVIGVRL